MHVTPANVAEAMSQGDHMQALLLALRLNERPLLQRVYEAVPLERIAVMAANLPRAYVSNMCAVTASAAPSAFITPNESLQAGCHRRAACVHPAHRVSPSLGDRDLAEPRCLAAGSVSAAVQRAPLARSLMRLRRMPVGDKRARAACAAFRRVYSTAWASSAV
jgi:hypothetical protein